MRFIATVHLVVESENDALAADAIGETLRNAVVDGAFLDWQYASLGKHMLHPTEYQGPIPIDEIE